MNSRSAKTIVSVFAAPVMAGLLMGPVLAVTSLLGGPGTETMVVQLVLIAACLIGIDELNRAHSLICQDRMSIIMSHVQRTGLWVVAGTITAACCWLIRRPDRDRARTELTFSE